MSRPRLLPAVPWLSSFPELQEAQLQLTGLESAIGDAATAGDDARLQVLIDEQGLLLGVGRYDANRRRHLQLRQPSQLRQYRLGLGPVGVLRRFRPAIMNHIRKADHILDALAALRSAERCEIESIGFSLRRPSATASA